MPLTRPGSSPLPHRSAESGVVLALCLLVMLILAVVVSQLLFTATVDHQKAENQALELQMESLAMAAIIKSHATLALDMEDDTAQSATDEGTGSMPGQAPDNGGPTVVGHTDSLDENWHSSEVPFDLGFEAQLETWIKIVDEDSKMNVLCLLSEDEEFRLAWRDRLVRAIDVLRDGKPEDLNRGEAEEIIDRIEGWMKGDRPVDELDKAPLATGGWMNENLDEYYPPLSLEELTMVGGLKPSLLYGFSTGEDDEEEWVPGLADILTVYSNLEMEEPIDPNDPPAEEEDDNLSVDRPKVQPAQGVNNGRINVNTSRIEVLRALFDRDIVSPIAWEDFDEYRTEVLEEQDSEDSFFSSEFEPSETGPVYPLTSVKDLRRFEGFSEESLMPEVWDEIEAALSVESNVFTITVVVATQEFPSRYYAARSVVWRRTNDSGDVAIVSVVPFSRISPASVDTSDLRKKLEEWQWSGDF